SQRYLISFHFLIYIVHFYRTCVYSHMVRKVLAHGKLLLTVSAEILFQWTNIVAWQQMPTFWGIAANLQETLIGVFVCFFICLLQGWKEVGREVMNYSFQ
uniref:Uncharacterized protein n=1 Tax=Spermophilus dauricus TaxID=99837 RepID=A0A8C9PKQ4_SPEDA